MWMMALTSYASLLLFLTWSLLASFFGSTSPQTLTPCDLELLQFALNLEFLEAEFFLNGALVYGLDDVSPDLARGGPKPTGVKRANLDVFVRVVIIQFAYQEVGHLRAIQRAVGEGGIPRPAMELSSDNFARLMRRALVAGLLAVESGQDAIIRALLYERAGRLLSPYPYTVADVTDRLSALRNSLGGTGDKDEGLYSPGGSRNWGLSDGNLLVGDDDSVGFPRTPREILRIVYGSGNETRPGGFFPLGAGGSIAQAFLNGTVPSCMISPTSP